MFGVNGGGRTKTVVTNGAVSSISRKTVSSMVSIRTAPSRRSTRPYEMNQFNQTPGATDAQSNMRTPSPHYFAQLLSPAEVAEATADNLEILQDLTKDRWILGGHVSEQMFSVLQGSSAITHPARLSAISTKDGAQYIVISHQIFNWQHRFLLPLYDERVQSFIKGATSGRIAYMLGNDGAREGIVFDDVFTAKKFLPVLQMCKPMSEEAQEEAMLEMSFIIDDLSKPERVASIFEMHPVKYVSVSAIMPQVLTRVLHEALFGMRQ